MSSRKKSALTASTSSLQFTVTEIALSLLRGRGCPHRSQPLFYYCEIKGTDFFVLVLFLWHLSQSAASCVLKIFLRVLKRRCPSFSCSLAGPPSASPSALSSRPSLRNDLSVHSAFGVQHMSPLKDHSCLRNANLPCQCPLSTQEHPLTQAGTCLQPLPPRSWCSR